MPELAEKQIWESRVEPEGDGLVCTVELGLDLLGNQDALQNVKQRDNITDNISPTMECGMNWGQVREWS